ncbi:MAG: SH3 domain-containing protein [Lewinellaceae bacterium]|nr:SH3 domain-containing protein [Lewinellaceae bacterium]
MKEKFGFTLFTPAEFETWIAQWNVARTILYVQEHHTWSPNYIHFKGNNHFDIQRGMQNFHRNVNGWMDIGQHFSIFPDGMIVTGRNLEVSPACIFGFNANAICIESIGNFDAGGDPMRPEQREAIVRTTAALCKRFNIPVNSNRIIYHHWFDLRTGARTNGSGSTKSCPGTAFFGGNKVTDAEKNFLPLVANVLKGGTVPPPVVPIMKYGYVTTDWLNIRNQPSAQGRKVNATPLGSILRVYEDQNGWYRISASKQEWVSGKYLQDVRRATVSADTLNVRSGPGTQFSQVTALSKGEAVFIYAESGSWVRISLDERWVSKNFLTIE